MTYLAVPIATKDAEQAKQQIKAAVAAGAEMIELRTDYLDGLSVHPVSGLVAEAKTAGGPKFPVIVTCRDKKQGGAADHPISLRIQILTGALQAGADYVDLEYENFVPIGNQEKIRLALAQRNKARLILSAHNFQTRFAEIGRIYRSMVTVCPGCIPKLVYTANHIYDCFEALDFLHRTSGERIVLCMGLAGLITRILAKKLGSFVTFASVDEQTGTAPGQPTVAQMKNLFRYDSIKKDTTLFGVIADPVGHSLSPAIHNASFAAAKMNCLYLPLLVQGGQREFDVFMRNALLRKWLDFKGFSITIPHKESALAFVKAGNNFVEPLAAKIGAVNTIVVSKDEKLKAYNTDYAAALDAITNGMRIDRSGLRGMNVAVVGAGGVARAIVAGLADVGAKITIYNRTVEKAQRLAAEFGCEGLPLEALAGLNAKLLINCTSVGMYPDVGQSPIPAECLKTDMVVFDTIYNPVETLLLKQAKAAGAKTIDGVSMFVNQAAAQFRLFTGQEGNPGLMRETVVEGLGG